MYSKRLKELASAIRRIKSLLPPSSPTGTYSDRDTDLTRAFQVLAHAEFETYFEDCSRDTVTEAVRVWRSHGKATRTVIALVTFCGRERGSPAGQPSTDIQTEAIKEAESKFLNTVRNNHGVKEANLLGLLAPSGVDVLRLDPALVATLNSFGSTRGLVAHTSVSAQRPPDPASVRADVLHLVLGLRRFDREVMSLRATTTGA